MNDPTAHISALFRERSTPWRFPPSQPPYVRQRRRTVAMRIDAALLAVTVFLFGRFEAVDVGWV